MIRMIKNDLRLRPYLAERLYDAGIEVGIDPSLSQDDYAAVKVDDYYDGRHMSNQPKAVDFVVTVDCECNWYVLYILELKNVKNQEGLNIPDIQEKFANTLKLFLQGDFRNIFENDRFKYRAVKLYLVSDAYHEGERFQDHGKAAYVRERMGVDTLKVDVALTQRIYKFRGKLVRIQYDIPPNPIIRKIL